MAAGHFHELHLTIKGHHLDAMGRRILDLRNLFAGVGIDDSAGIHSKRLNQLDLRLHRDKHKFNCLANSEPDLRQGCFQRSNTFGIFPRYLACTVEATSERCQCHNYSPAVIAFDSIERSYTRQGPQPAQVFLNHVSQVTDVEGIPVILKLSR